MENSSEFSLENQKLEWFIAMGQQWAGPLPAAEVIRRVVAREISLAQFVWRKGQKDWQRICDTDAFKALCPQTPAQALPEEPSAESPPEFVEALPPPAPRVALPQELEAAQKIWFLACQGVRSGPFSTPEIESALERAEIQGQAYLWRKGMKEWARIEAVAHFSATLTKLESGASLSQRTAVAGYRPLSRKQGEQRRGSRRPLSAKILLVNENPGGTQQLVSAVCRDISVGGMQVMADPVPGAVGDKVRLNVSPWAEASSELPGGLTGQACDKMDASLPHPSGSASAPAFASAFAAEGRIVRIFESQEGGRGFSFRFERISDNAKRAIEAFIEQSSA